ncbi:MAG: lytic murein transglycosylase [Methyloligellaceae bacterium]
MNIIRLLLIASLAFSSLSCMAHAAKVSRAQLSKEFKGWLKELKAEAGKKGISKKTLDLAFKGVKLQWKLPDLAIHKPKKPKRNSKIKRQPEFSSPGKYFPKNYLNTLSKRSRKLYKKWKVSLGRIEKKYGVDAGIVLSIWGRETSFGRTKLPHYAIEVLTTQAYMGRRKEYFRNELLIALQILEQGHVTPANMKSSWAGAMGYTQFMPNDFRLYAVDHDGDGKRDIWKNKIDALASTANYLSKNGWQQNKTWGYEVRVSKKLDCRLEGFDNGRTIAEWMKIGVSRIGKKSFTKEELGQKAYLLIPGGIKGPAFLVTDNFLVIKTYNQANLYAIFVGHLADRTFENKGFSGRWPKVKVYARSHMRSVQEQLSALGYKVGKIDGIIGPKSRTIIGDFQSKNKLPVTCALNRKFFALLDENHRKISKNVR